jgi:hypothetical protein
VDIKLVSRVLKMSRISTNHLQWCQKRLGKLGIHKGKVHRARGTVLFPYWSYILSLPGCISCGIADRIQELKMLTLNIYRMGRWGLGVSQHHENHSCVFCFIIYCFGSMMLPGRSH